MNKVIKGKKSSFLPILLLSIALSACKNNEEIINTNTISNNIIVENNIVNEEVKEESYYSVYKDDTFISIRKNYYKVDEAFDDNTINEINEHIKSHQINTLMLDNVDNELDLNKFNLDNLTDISITRADETFDYKPLYNHEYNYIALHVDEKSNTVEQIKFLNNITYNNAIIYLYFEDGELEIPQMFIDTFSTKNNIREIAIYTNKMNDLDFSNLNTPSLTIYNHETEQIISHEITVNDNLRWLTIQPYYDEDYKEVTALKNIKINTNSVLLETKINFIRLWDEEYDIFATDETIISVPDYSSLILNNLNPIDVDDAWFNQFDKTSSTIISNNSNPNEFKYNKGNTTIEEAIKLFKDEANIIKL